MLGEVLPSGRPLRLHEAMRYAVLAPGKRMRPLLAYASAEALAINPERVDRIAAAVEIIHAYSLIHDDLPAMDDDDYRRGRPTCHRQFDEATAILAGDALQALAFEVLTDDASVRGPASGRLTRALGHACGSRGMAGGQAIDLAAVGNPLSEAELFEMHELKTGALIRAAVTLPALLAESPQEQLEALDEYGRLVGLAFQIQDDILDVSGNPDQTGKTAGADAALHKPTFPSVLGMTTSSQRAHELSQAAKDRLTSFSTDTTLLAALAGYAVDRHS